MSAVTWQGHAQLSVDDVPDPTIQGATDAIVRVTSTAICGSDLRLDGVLGMFLDEGDIIGHEPMDIVEAVDLPPDGYASSLAVALSARLRHRPSRLAAHAGASRPSASADRTSGAT